MQFDKLPFFSRITAIKRFARVVMEFHNVCKETEIKMPDLSADADLMKEFENEISTIHELLVGIPKFVT